jgi:GMP synthase-like glutamine amidotransferase
VRIHYLQHVASEGPGSIRQWAEGRGHLLTSTPLYRGETLPDVKGFDWLVVMGGPMSANNESAHPWLVAEKKLIGRAIAGQKVVLGICLGAQLIANVLGATVYKNRCAEIGWFPVRLTRAAAGSEVFGFLPEIVRVFHWHGETFDLPPGATHIAESEACANQAFVHGSRVIGIQFHPESTRESVEGILGQSAADLVPGPFVQSRREVLASDEEYAELRAVMFGILDRLATVV